MSKKRKKTLSKKDKALHFKVRLVRDVLNRQLLELKAAVSQRPDKFCHEFFLCLAYRNINVIGSHDILASIANSPCVTERWVAGILSIEVFIAAVRTKNCEINFHDFLRVGCCVETQS